MLQMRILMQGKVMQELSGRSRIWTHNVYSQHQTGCLSKNSIEFCKLETAFQFKKKVGGRELVPPTLRKRYPLGYQKARVFKSRLHPPESPFCQTRGLSLSGWRGLQRQQACQPRLVPGRPYSSGWCFTPGFCSWVFIRHSIYLSSLGFQKYRPH